MVMELRKRKAAPPQQTAAVADKPAPTAKRQRRATTTATKQKQGQKPSSKKTEEKQTQSSTTMAADNAPATPSAPKCGDKIDLDKFGGTVKKNDGSETTLQKLVEESNKGVVIFTYPKASTPGCTTQACLFRDSYKELTEAGFAVYGLSADSPNANTNFQTKQKLPYPLLCDPEQTLIGALGLKKSPKGTVRGVFMADKNGQVLLLQPGSPTATLEETKKKWCTQSEGIWEKIRQVFSIAPNRSNGISLNTSYRNPPPGANDPLAYDDRVTLPAGDIAENPYWKRDNRRKYPRQSYVNQADVVGLLTVGSKATPKEEVLQIGEAGEKQLAEVKTQGEQQGLSVFFEKNKEVGKSIFGTNGLPPMPANLNPASRYTFDHEHGYDEEKYPCRTFV
ncbi:NADH-ubiquinone oxidoreductase 21.3 kDa subunit [Ascosphaera apis ARSEF 7405]|uniref:thioredoxin-dependent peroxiredoxin n=1 Tax=Ascosphaera apis ARSEF 7405 TaxID=392613 RepID=A0A162IQW6_9EURO|nr:NADH-ubiquinone oxidoreductase 21.3 kDa subunit [Ascosphaera apis ARSEF 7405]